MYNIKELKYSYIFYGYWECFIKKKVTKNILNIFLKIKCFHTNSNFFSKSLSNLSNLSPALENCF